MIKRAIESRIKERFFKGKAIIVIGARQTGKTTLINQILQEHYNGEFALFNCDEGDVRDLLTNANSSSIKRYIGDKKVLFIDEAQRIENIGIAVKLVTDQIKNVQVIVSGSSSLELADKIKEPLTGRKYEYLLFPLSFNEMTMHHGLLEEKRAIENRILYGYYPEIVVNEKDAAENLNSIANSYLYKDVFSLASIRKPHFFEKLLKAIALQTGSEVSYNELSGTVGIDKQTVEKYIDLLEKTFVVFQLNSFSRNVRNELKKSKKIYFYDTGIRNAVINNFNTLANRADKGALWENFIISERIKNNINKGMVVQSYFWRTTQKQEIDYIEEDGSRLKIFEIKWNAKGREKFPRTFIDNYEISEKNRVNIDNYDEFINQ